MWGHLTGKTIILGSLGKRAPLLLGQSTFKADFSYHPLFFHSKNPQRPKYNDWASKWLHSYLYGAMTHIIIPKYAFDRADLQK